VETGVDYTCRGEKDETICVWRLVGQTAYTVQNADLNQCTGSKDDGSPYVMWSPNSNNVGSRYYCVHGAQSCRNQGDRWLDTSGRAGGP